MTYRRIKEKTGDLLLKHNGESKISLAIDWAIIIMIILSVVAIILESFPELAIHYYPIFRGFETFTVIFFTVEYVARIWTADCKSNGKEKSNAFSVLYFYYALFSGYFLLRSPFKR